MFSPIVQLRILVIEDNPGDFILIADYLKEQNTNVILDRAVTFEEAEQKLKNQNHFDAILLDLSLPDARGETLVSNIVRMAGPIPVVVLTGFADRAFGITTLALGISDYLLKDDLNASQIYKSISYSIERRRIDQKLKETEAKYQRLFHFSPLPMLVYDVQSLVFLDANEAALQLYGYPKNEFVGMSISSILPENRRQEYLDKVMQLRTSRSHYRTIAQHLKKSGELMFIETQSDPIDFGGIRARLLVSIDITEKTRATRALELSEQRFKALVQDGADLIAILETDGVYKYVSPASKSILGISAEDLIGKKAMDYIHEDDRERVQHDFDLLDRQKAIHIEPFRVRDAHNNWRWIETKLTNLVHDPSVGGIVANSLEVSDRIQNELKLKESVDRYNIVSKATSDVIWDWNMLTDSIEWNENIKVVLGYDSTLTSEAWWEERVHPDDIERVESKLNRSLLQVSEYWSDEYRFRCSDDSYKFFFDRGFLMTDENGKALRMIGSMQDITKQKEEQHHLKLLESVITHATDAVMITEAKPLDEPGPRIVYVNNAFTQMTGYSREEVIGKSPRFLQGPLSSREKLSKVKEAIKHGERFETEIVNYRKDGTTFWLNMAIAPVADNAGDITHFISIQRDITDQMNYVKAIEEQNERLKEISWTQSHVVRAPLARIMGLIEILPKYDAHDEIPKEILKYILNSAHELDHIIREIVLKTEGIYNTPKK